MNGSTINTEFLIHTREALHKYENLQIPFAAVKICIDGLNSGGKALDKIVCDNFRSDTDVILKSKSDYAVLMQNTSIEAAEAAVHRLGGRLCRIPIDINSPQTNSPICATAWIYGAGEETKGLHFRYIDLVSLGGPKKTGTNWRDHVGKYYQWMEPYQLKNHKPFSIKV